MSVYEYADIVLRSLDDDSEIDFESSESEDEIFNSSSSSSSSTSSTEEPRRKLHRIESFLETVESYDDREFKEHFRLNRSTCTIVIEMIENENVLPKHNYGREKISPKKAFLMTLWYLVNMETFREVSDRFNVSKGSAHRIITKVVEFLTNKAKDFIVWPTGPASLRNKSHFKKFQGIDGVVGAIDGCHIKIKRPNSKHSHVYFNRKGECSILIQAVCDSRKKFTDFFCGEPGSIHDSRLLKKSALYRKCMNGFLGNDFILGDSAYPCLEWLIPPFRDNGNLTQNQKIFNYRHSATRIVIENAFGLLKGRFRKLKYFENANILFCVKCVISAAVLHNICIDNNDNENEVSVSEPDTEELENVTASVIHEQQSKRNEIFENMFLVQL